MAPPTTPSAAAWNAALIGSLGERNFEHWFRGRTSVSVEGGMLTVGANQVRGRGTSELPASCVRDFTRKL